MAQYFDSYLVPREELPNREVFGTVDQSNLTDLIRTEGMTGP